MNEQAPDADLRVAQVDTSSLPALNRRVSVHAVLVTGDANQGQALAQAGIFTDVAIHLVSEELNGIPAVLEIAPGPGED